MTSTIKVNTVTTESGSTLTLGGCGKTVALASGASQSGFGRTGTVDWQTGDIKTSTFTAESGKGYFCDTTSGQFEMDLPAGSAGAIVSVQDYNNTFDSNSLSIDPNGSEKINGGTAGDPISLTTEGQGLTLVYIDSTVGWRSVQDNTFAEVGASFISATGGTITTSGDCKIHTFTGPGTFCVSAIGAPANNVVSYMVIAGGGASGASCGPAYGGAGGGGAGGFREYKSPVTPYTASPLDGNPGGTAVTITATGFPITVGAGAAGTGNTTGARGSNSIFSTITSTGGGGGRGAVPSPGRDPANAPGGSGGGGTGPDSGSAGTGNTPPVSPPQGNNGGTTPGPSGAPGYGAGGGGGAGSAGSNGAPPGPAAGGNGVATSITGSPVTRAGGGGGGTSPGTSAGAAGPGGGGAGQQGGNGNNGTANTGGGGGGAGGTGTATPRTGGSGGSGIVVIRYKFQ